MVVLRIPGVHELEVAKEPVLGDGRKEPGKVLVVQLEGVCCTGCLFYECCKLAQLADGVAISKGMRADLAANRSKDVGQCLPKSFGSRLNKCNDGASFLELFCTFGQDISRWNLAPASEIFFVFGEDALELLLDLHVFGKWWGVGNGEDAGVGESICDGVVVECRAIP